MDSISNASSTIDANTQLVAASVTTTGDISARYVTATRELHVDGDSLMHCQAALSDWNSNPAHTFCHVIVLMNKISHRFKV